MTTVPCSLCNTPLPSDHSAVILNLLKEKVANLGGWYIFEEDYPVGATFQLENNMVVKVFSKKESYVTGDISQGGYYSGDSPLMQGDTFNTCIIFEVNGNYFRKTGSGDSYGEATWDGDFTIVKPKEVTTLVFE